MKDFSVDDFAAIVGIDWADKKHDICELPAGTRVSVITIIDVVKFTLFEGLAVLSVNHVTFHLSYFKFGY